MKKRTLLSTVALGILSVLCALLFVACGDGSTDQGGDGGTGDVDDSPVIPSTFEPIIEISSGEKVSLEFTAGETINLGYENGRYDKYNDADGRLRLVFPVEVKLYAAHADTAPYMMTSETVSIDLSDTVIERQFGYSGDYPGYWDINKLYADEDFKPLFDAYIDACDAKWIMDRVNKTSSGIIDKYIEEFVKKNFPDVDVSDRNDKERLYEDMCDNEPEKYIRDISAAKKAIADTVEIKIQATVAAPQTVALRKIISDDGNHSDTKVPFYSYQTYDELALKIDGVGTKKVDKSLFEDFGSLADEKGVHIKFAEREVVYKGVRYKLESGESRELKTLDGKVYDCNGLKGFEITGDKLVGKSEYYYGSGGAKRGYSEHHINKDDIVSVSSDLYQAHLSLKSYTDEQCSEYKERSIQVPVENVLKPDKWSVDIPDMAVAEIDDKWTDTLVSLEYSDEFKLEMKLSECDATKINRGNLLANIKSAATQVGERTVYCFIGNNSSESKKCTFTLSPSLSHVTFVDKSGLLNEYYEHQTFIVPDVEITEHYYNSYSAYESGVPDSTKTKPAPADTFKGCQAVIDGGVGGTGKIVLGDEALHPEKCDVYEFSVKADTVSSIEVKLDAMFAGIIVGEPVDFCDSYIIATFSHGQTACVPMTEDMVGTASGVGMQDVEITYRGKSATVEMGVHKIKSISVYEGLDKYYLLNDEPSTEVWLTTKFDGEDDFDIIKLPADRTPKLDLTKAGGGSVSISYGGATTSFTYNVIEGAYISYTESEGKLTLSKFVMGKPAADAAAWVPEDIKNIVIPQEIDGKPVVKLAANLFKGQSILRTLTVPATVAEVGAGTVDGCVNLTKLTVTGALQLKSYFTPYKAGTMASKATYPDIPKNLEVVISGDSLCDDFLSDMYFENTGKTLKKLTLNNNVESFGNQSSYDLSYVKSFAGDGDKVFAVDDVVYADGGKTLAYYSAFKTDKVFAIPDDVTAANMTSAYIEQLSVPAGVARLGEGFMNRATSLKKATFASGSAVTVLPDSAFSGCEKLSDFTFPQNLQTIGDFVLSDCLMEKLIIPAGVTSVGTGAFNGAECTHLYVPTGATSSLFAGSYQTIRLNNLAHVAYDGSTGIYKLSVMDINTKDIRLYITGENTDVTNEWYSNGVNQRVSTVYVCEGAASFSIYAGAMSYSGTVVYEKNGETIDKWWS